MYHNNSTIIQQVLAIMLSHMKQLHTYVGYNISDIQIVISLMSSYKIAQVLSHYACGYQAISNKAVIEC